MNDRILESLLVDPVCKEAAIIGLRLGALTALFSCDQTKDRRDFLFGVREPLQLEVVRPCENAALRSGRREPVCRHRVQFQDAVTLGDELIA